MTNPQCSMADERIAVAGIQVGSMLLVTERGAESLHSYPMKFIEVR